LNFRNKPYQCFIGSVKTILITIILLNLAEMGKTYNEKSSLFSFKIKCTIRNARHRLPVEFTEMSVKKNDWKLTIFTPLHLYQYAYICWNINCCSRKKCQHLSSSRILDANFLKFSVQYALRHEKQYHLHPVVTLRYFFGLVNQCFYKQHRISGSYCTINPKFRITKINIFTSDKNSGNITSSKDVE